MAALRKRTRIEDSDDESQSEKESPSPTRSPSPKLRDDLPAGELYQAARLQQKKVNDARKELWAAQCQLADITNQDDTAPKRGRKKRKIVYGGSDEETKEVKNLAQLWIPDLQKTVNTKVDDQYNPLERFENVASMVQGELADLLETLPEKFHGEVMRSEWFVKEFHTAMGTQHSNAAGRLRRECGPEIFDCTAADLSTSEARRDKFHEQIGYVEDAEGKPHYEAFNVDLLHKDYNGSYNIKTVFRSPALHLVRWAASADIELTPRSAETGINWQGNLEKYIEYLQNGLDKRKTSVLKIFHSSLAVTDGGEDHTEKHVQDVMNLLNADDEEVPEAD
ncbi:hypothetical protein B0H19DRAFT_1243025 [Mycena capillaripes]|nr:hypothetical protein B0H19DRAFT_1243025 [Mycena capillaripes]